MTRDLVDTFNRNADRGRFGDQEIRGNDSVRSDLIDLMLVLRLEKPKSIAVTLVEGDDVKWIWLPKVLIEFEIKGPRLVNVTLSGRLAKEKGLI